MSELQELIERYCPDGVEYKALGEIGELTKGSGLQKKDFTDSGVGCIHYGQIHTRFNVYTDRVVSYVPKELAAKLTIVEPGDVVVAVTSEDVSACCKAVAWMGTEPVVTGGHAVVIKTGMNPKFISYCFTTADFFRQKKKLAIGVKVVEMRTDRLARIKIPTPPLEVQNEVVRLLDAHMTAHDALVGRLNEEIELQTKSLAAYRESLLTFEERGGVRLMALGEIAMIKTGAKPKSEVGDVFGYLYVNAGTTASGFVDDWNTGGDTVTTPSRGQGGIGHVSYYAKPFWCGPLCYRIRSLDESVSNKYLYYALTANRYQILGCMKEGGTPAINQRDLRNVMLPVPTLDEQARIVGLLDKLVPSTNSLCDAIRSEASLLESQLVEFRNRLLTFPEKAA